ncbi:bifunctional adenosylcobinamide kinase/adenosylcobinamide-phosphate guanylyltransferase [Paenibacillus whitsoniae]|uniref:Adenosylcobinamide kinase n=1 Tax=Paenibacillus whitsoniae TaxID=2496558 RepID=A0A3S0AAZ6_9BACL|nr:bifunctional adenosylcobinamide kinase/adenosylcobinamide-phosphate guanylyltransferase [Paenibacillus whitsoniae]
MAVLITGGARSGKSGFAERLAMHRGSHGIYIATSQIYDEEMRERVSRHRRQRETAGFPWVTQEEPLGLLELLTSSGLDGGNLQTVVLVDCLTLWLTNWLLKVESEPNCEELVMQQIKELADAVSSYSGHLLLVTNEVGDGIVPEYPLGRQFRDLAGWMNQRLAEVCEEVFLVTAGIPVELKSIAYRIGDGAATGQADSRLPSQAPGSQAPDTQASDSQAPGPQSPGSQEADTQASTPYTIAPRMLSPDQRR